MAESDSVCSKTTGSWNTQAISSTNRHPRAHGFRENRSRCRARAHRPAKDGSTVEITIDGIGTLVNTLARARDIAASHASRTIVAGETPSFAAARHG
jgi:hypothetical protein